MEEHPWSDLQTHYNTIKDKHLRDLLKDDNRNQALLLRHGDILLDVSHEKVTAETIKTQFPAFVQKTFLREKIRGLFDGSRINFTEKRAVLHTCLRAPLLSSLHDSTQPFIEGVLKDVHKVLDQVKEFSNKVRKGEWLGATGKPLKNLIVAGIGGSYLSVEFVYEALRSHPECQKLADGRRLRFLANVDPIDFNRATQGLNAEETLVLVNSKTFTTAETMLNARSCKQWLISEYSKIGVTDEVLIAKQHLCACSTNLPATSAFGISQNNVFAFWDFVGGRFSVWSAIGVLPLAIQFGYEVVEQFLAGGHSIDSQLLHQQNPERNLPMMLGLLGFYRTTVQGYDARAIIPYCQALCKLAPHIQQLDMESNGKRVNSKGEAITYKTAGINFGEPGTNGQHSFFQLLHQGRPIPVQFIGFAKSQQPLLLPDSLASHDELMSNFFSQPDALAIGKTRAQLEAENTPASLLAHKEFPGDRASSSLLFLGELNAYRCGQLLALYEHRTSIEGFLWDVNSYDQYGVELGKVLAQKVRSLFQQGPSSVQGSGLNSATRNLLLEYMNHH